MTNDRPQPIKKADPDRPYPIGIDPAAYEGDIVSRLRHWRGLHLAHNGELFEAAAAEIERLRLTDAERDAVTEAAEWYGGVESDERCQQIAATLRGLLGCTPPTQPTPGECSSQEQGTCPPSP